MTKQASALDSFYIIDGRETEASPREILSVVYEGAPIQPTARAEDIIDESADPQPANDAFDPLLAKAYADAVANTSRGSFPFSYSGSLSRLAVAKALLQVLFHDGSFKLGDLRGKAVWHWNEGPACSMAAFYESVSWACEYIDALGIKLYGYQYSPSDRNSLDIVFDKVASSAQDEALFDESPFISHDAHIGPALKCPAKALAAKGDWIVYIPFDTCKHRLGGSLLSQATGKDGGKSPDVTDADYFIDCYEVVRELVEDGIAIAGVPVADGGLMPALSSFTAGQAFKADIASVMRACEETDLIKLLFAEIPGVLIQIKDFDFDYLDAELLLQDVAYYPLGQLSGTEGPLELETRTGSALKGILVSLMDSASEGED